MIYKLVTIIKVFLVILLIPCCLLKEAMQSLLIHTVLKRAQRDFLGGDSVVRNPPVNARDVGSSPGLGRFHMPQSN